MLNRRHLLNLVPHPKTFLKFCHAYRWLFHIISTPLIIFSLFYAFIASPIDHEQGGNLMRILYVHVPSSWLCLSIYTAITILSILFIISRNPSLDIYIQALLPVGLHFSCLSLITGAIWGIPTWGTWWAWDARLTFTLMLTLLYGGLCMLHAQSYSFYARRAYAYITIIGFVHIPLIKGAVIWWNTLHQPASFMRFDGTYPVATSITYTLLFMTMSSVSVAFALFKLHVQRLYAITYHHRRKK